MIKIFSSALIFFALISLSSTSNNHTFFENILNEVIHKQKNTHMSMPLCQNTHLAATFEKFLKVPKTGPFRLHLLKEFLCIKHFQYFEMINYLSIDELRQLLKDFSILKNVQVMPRHGTDRCNLKTMALESAAEFQEICPW